VKGKTFLAGMFVVLLALAGWLAWQTQGALERRDAGTWPSPSPR
jgi:predicted negative regulator of RcsB-dependent stress response